MTATFNELKTAPKFNINDRKENHFYKQFTAVCFKDNRAYDAVICRRVLTRDNGNDYRNAEEAAGLNRIFRTRPLLPGEIRILCDHCTAEETAERILAALKPEQSV